MRDSLSRDRSIRRQQGKARLLVVKLLISVGLVVFLASQVDLQAMTRRIADIGPLALVLGIGGVAALPVAGALRWGVVLRTMDCALPYCTLLGMFWLGMFFGQVLPSMVGGDAMRMWRARLAGLSTWAAISGVVTDRVVGLIGLVLVVAAGTPILLSLTDEPGSRWAVAALFAIAAAAVVVLCFLDSMPARLQRWSLFAGIARFSASTRGTLLRSGRAPTLLLLAIVMNLLTVAAIYALGHGMGIPIHFSECVIVVPLALLTSTIPISIAGWGVREGAMVTGFGYFGVAPADALAISVVFGLVLIVGSLPGGLVWAFTGGGGRAGATDEGLGAQSSHPPPDAQRG